MLARVVLLSACLAPFLIGGVCGKTTNSVLTTTSAPTRVNVQTHLISEGDSGKIQCPTKDQVIPGSNLEFAWTYHGLPHIEHGYFDEISGSLYINEADIKASGRYDCFWSASDRDGKKSGKYSHQLIVYKVPDVQLQISTPFRVQECLESVDSQVIKRYRKKLCPSEVAGEDDCPYEVSYQCSDVGGGDVTTKSRAQLVVNVKVTLPADYSAPSCDTDCIRKNMAMVLNSLKESLQPKWNEVFRGDSEAFKWYNSNRGNAREEVQESCEDGFLPYNASVCAPCEPGSFWDAGSKTCTACPVNTYQDRAGAKECKRCPKGKKTSNKGVTSIAKCFAMPTDVPDASGKHVREESRKKKKNVDAKSIIIASSIGVGFILLFVVLALLILLCLIKKNERRQDNLFMLRRMEDAERFERLFGSEKLSSERIVDDSMNYPSTSKDNGGRDSGS